MTLLKTPLAPPGRHTVPVPAGDRHASVSMVEPSDSGTRRLTLMSDGVLVEEHLGEQNSMASGIGDVEFGVEVEHECSGT